MEIKMMMMMIAHEVFCLFTSHCLVAAANITIQSIVLQNGWLMQIVKQQATQVFVNSEYLFFCPSM
jgi:hypothetical protein